jgi:hypothetical protein
MRKFLVGAFLAGAVAATLLAWEGMLTAGFIWVKGRTWDPPSSLKIDLQAELGCPNGVMMTIKRRFADRDIPLENGADSLTICDHEALQTSASQVPRDLAAKYPACLEWKAGRLSLLRKSPAVCARPRDEGFVCDGAKARVALGSGMLGLGQSVTRCSPEMLAEFGFRS